VIDCKILQTFGKNQGIKTPRQPHPENGFLEQKGSFFPGHLSTTKYTSHNNTGSDRSN